MRIFSIDIEVHPKWGLFVWMKGPLRTFLNITVGVPYLSADWLFIKLGRYTNTGAVSRFTVRVYRITGLLPSLSLRGRRTQARSKEDAAS